MKLKNKKTGENYETTMPIVFNIKTSGGGELTVRCKSIAELNEKWEDVPEEPKGIVKVEKSIAPNCVHIEYSTEEEAELSVRKLKAWKRLEDKGFKVDGWGLLEYGGCDRFDYSPHIGFSIPNLDKDEPYEYPEKIEKDLDICFGGEK